MKFSFFFCLTPFLLSSPLSAKPQVEPNDTLLVTGEKANYEGDYAAFMADYLLMCQPTPGLHVVDASWPSTEGLSGLMPRIESDILPFNPNVLILWYGMEEGGFRAFDASIGGNFQAALTQAVEKLKTAGIRTILIGSPGVVDADAYQNSPEQAAIYNKSLSAMGDISRQVALKEGVDFADVHSAMMDAMTKAKASLGPAYHFGDASGRRTEQNSQLVTAYAFLKALDCDGAIATLTADLDKQTADGTPGQKILSFQNGVLTVESTRYPFCFQDHPDKFDSATTSVLKFVPFNEDLNRYLLVVKGLKTARTKITWGGESKEFSSADLAKGINLAAEFLQNPFAGAFFKVDQAVRDQQGKEIELVTAVMHSLKFIGSYMTTGTAEVAKVAAAAAAQDKSNFEAAAALVVPVRHTLTIEPISP